MKENNKTASPREMYSQACGSLGLSPNSGLLRTLPETTACLSNMGVMHFGRNFLGDRGVLPLLPVLACATSLHTLNLSENGIGNDGVKALCRALRHHASLRVLELSGNPFTYLAARQLVYLCESCPSLATIGIENTLMTEPLKAGILRRVQNVLSQRGRYEKTFCVSPVERNNNVVLSVVEEDAREQTTAAPLWDALHHSALTLSTGRNSAVTPATSRVEGVELRGQPVVGFMENLVNRPPPVETAAHEEQKKYAIWMDTDDELEEEKPRRSQRESVREQLPNLATLTLEENDEFKASCPAHEHRELEDEDSMRHEMCTDAPLITHLSSRMRSSQRHSDERNDTIGDSSGVSSLTLEVRAAVARGMFEDLESMTKEDEFLDLFCLSGME